jgi:amino acid efflux transporter
MRTSRSPGEAELTSGARASQGGSPRKLSRTLGVRHLVAYYVSSLVGVGLLATPLLTAEIAGPACLIAWGMLVLLSYPFAHVFARISMAHPHSGGIASFVQHVLGSRTGNVIGLVLVAALVTLTTAMGMVTAEYLHVLLGLSRTSTLVPLGMAAIAASVLTNLIGLRLGSRVQAAGLLALITTLIALLIVSAPHAQPENLTPFAPAGWTAIGSAAVICFVAFLGWENVATLAEEVRDPEKTFAQAIRWATTIVGVLYVALAAMTVLVLPLEGVSLEGTVVSALVTVGAGDQAARVADAIAVGVLIIATNAWVLGCSRLIYALAREGVLPRRLSALSRRAATPHRALLALAGACMVVAGCASVAGLQTADLLTVAVATFVLVYLVCFVAVLRHFRSRRIRRLAWTALASTTAFVPFLGNAIVVPAAMGALAYSAVVLADARRRARGRLPQPAATTSVEGT